MKFFLYSDKITPDLNRMLMQEFNINKAVITYVPSASTDKAIAYFEAFKKSFAHENIQEFYYLTLDQSFDYQSAEKLLKKSDILFLSGGHTFDFIKNIRSAKFDQLIVEFSNSEKLLLGQSAGAILMSPSLNTAQIIGDTKSFTQNKNQGLGLFNYEICPHYTESLDPEIISYSKSITNTILALPEDSAAIINNGRLTCSGKAYLFERGIKTNINS
jgi:dipeptidase E